MPQVPNSIQELFRGISARKLWAKTVFGTLLLLLVIAVLLFGLWTILGRAFEVSVLDIVWSLGFGFASFLFFTGKSNQFGIKPKNIIAVICVRLLGLVGFAVALTMFVNVCLRIEGFWEFHRFTRSEADRVTIGCHVLTNPKQVAAIVEALRQATAIGHRAEPWKGEISVRIRLASGKTKDYMIARRLYFGAVAIPLNDDRDGVLAVPQMAQMLEQAGLWHIRPETSPYGLTNDVITVDGCYQNKP